jgi:hypothetical protein
LALWRPKKKARTVKGLFLKKELQKSPYFEEKQSQKSSYLDYEFLLVAITRQESFKKKNYCLFFWLHTVNQKYKSFDFSKKLFQLTSGDYRNLQNHFIF